MNKRTDQRHNCEISISYRYFIKDETFNGKIMNFCKRGIYFESDEFIRERTTIYFWLTNGSRFPSAPEFCEGLRSVSLAEVKWCREMKNEKATCFGIGVKYY